MPATTFRRALLVTTFAVVAALSVTTQAFADPTDPTVPDPSTTLAPSTTLPPETTTTAPPPTAPPTTRPRGPQAPAGTGSGRRIVYCNRCQRVWLVGADNVVERSYLVSGRAGVPRPGTYHVFSKSPSTVSGSVTMRYMTRFARGKSMSIGFHTIPRDRRGRPIQSLGQLGTFRSHGCVRQADADAIALWGFAPLGTTVVVV
jgi:hypothetical protein